MSHEQLLVNLVEIKSYSGEEENLRNFVRDWLTQHGIESFIQDQNLLVHLEGVDRTKAFIFNSHMDTVSAGDKWTRDPWKLTKEGTKAIGLGVSDMKSGLASSMLLADKVHTKGIPPVDIWFTYVVKEEQDGSGTESFVRWFQDEGYLRRYKNTAAIFTEPNSLKEIEHGHRGNYFLVVEASGPSGHASRPYELEEELAVRKMFRFSNEFSRAVDRWNKQYPDKYFRPAITVGEMTSFVANAEVKKSLDSQGHEVLTIIPGSPNKFPESAVATFDLRTTPLTHDFLYGKVLKIAEKVGVRVNQLYPPANAGFTDPKEQIVKIASRIGKKRALTVSQASADLGFLTTHGIKSIILGPGVKEECHKPDEYCYPAEIPEAVDLYDKIVSAWAK